MTHSTPFVSYRRASVLVCISVLCALFFVLAHHTLVVKAAAVSCPVSDGGAGDGDSTVNGTIEISSNTTWSATTGYAADGDYWDCTGVDIHVTSSSTLTFEGDTANGYHPYLKTDSLTVDSGSAISADEEGCDPNNQDGSGPNTSTNICTSQESGYGQGRANTTNSNLPKGGGAGYGGAGADSDSGRSGGTTYGVLAAPTLFGSSGGTAQYQSGSRAFGGSGGGVVHIETSSNLTLNGTISADGGTGLVKNTYSSGGGGSGGSVYLYVTGTFSGTTGVLSADGGASGNATNGDGGGGGGGRVAVLYGTDSSGFLSGLSAATTSAGGSGNGAADGSDGTLYTAAISSPGPEMQSAVTADNDSDGQIDRVIVSTDVDVDAGTIAGSDFTVSGYTVSSASRTADSEITIVIAESGSDDTDATPEVEIVGSIDDLDSDSTTSGTVEPTDGAAPIPKTYTYKDTNTDGTIDRLDITFSENIAYDECDVADYSFAGTDAGSIAVASAGCATSGDDLRLTLDNAPANTTYLDMTFSYTAANGTADSVDDAAGNAIADISGAALTDGAGPLLRTDGSNGPKYIDNNLDGNIDRAQLTFTEDVTVSYSDGDWTATANDLTSFDVSAVTTNSTTVIELTAGADGGLTGVNGGTEPTLAFTATTGSIQDAASNALASFGATTVSDGAAPALVQATINDTDNDGLIDRLVLIWSENVDTDDSAAPVLADFGTITLPDGETVSSATFTDPAGASAEITVTSMVGQSTANTAAGSFGFAGITNQWTDGTNATSNPDGNIQVVDGAKPIFVSAEYKDTNTDGQVDRVDVTFSETMTLDSYDASDWSFPVAGDMNLSDSGASASGSDIRITVSADALTTGSDTTPTVLYTNNGNRLNDGTNNVLTFGAAQTVDDGAGPALRTDGANAPIYLDNDTDGTLDRLQLTFTEDVTITYSDGDWSATANDLTGFDTGAYVSGNGTTQVLLSVTANANLTGVSGGTEPTIAFSASGGSIADDNGATLSSFSATSVTDGAAPVRVSQNYNDIDGNGTVDRFDVTFSETIAYDECEAGDWTIGGGDAGSFAVGSCASSGADLRLTMTGGPANDTGLTLTLAYDASAGTADSLDDGTPGNAVGDLTAQSLTDNADPILVSFDYEDTDQDGQIDRVSLNFSESVSFTYDPTDFTVTANDVTGFAFQAGSVTDNSTSTPKVPATANSGITGVSGGTQPTISWSPTSGSVADGTGNTTSSIAETSGTDAAAMVIVSQSYKDTNADGQVDRADLTFSENIALGECEASDYSFAGDDAGTIAVASCAVSTTDLQLTLSNAPAADTNLSLSISYDQSNSTADSLEDSEGNAIGDLTNQTLADAAAPQKVSQQYVDSNSDGQIDRADITFTENISLDECETSDYTLGGADAGGVSIVADSCSASGTDVRLTLTGTSANDTYMVLTLAYDATNGIADSVDDAAGNAAPSLVAASLSDGAVPIASSKTYNDDNSDGTIDQVILTMTEDMSVDECDTEDWVISGADSGSIGVVDATGCSIVDNVITLTLENTPANDTNLAIALTYDASEGTADSLRDEGSVVVSDLSFSSLTDAAAPVRVSQSYTDIDTNGVIDRLDVVFTEDMTVATCEISDYTFGGADAGSFAVSACTASSATVQYTLTGGPSNDTNVIITFAYDQSNETADSLQDATGNAVGDLSGASVSDAAAPVLRTDNGSKSTYLDSDADGQVDQVRLVFTEAVNLTYDDADWTATANDLTSFDVSALESGDGTTTLILTATAAANLTGVDEGTEPNLVFADASNLTDGTNALTAINVNLTDGAAPVATAQSYLDTDNNGAIDRVDVTFTETIDYDECEGSDFSFTGDDAGSLGVSACAQSGDDLQLTVTGGASNDTNLSVNLVYDASANTADSLDDDDSNAVQDFTLALADQAAPVRVSQSYKDTNTDGTIDRLDITFSEDIAIDECDVSDYTFGGADAGTIAVEAAGCTASGADLQLTLENTPSLDTNITVTLAYDASNLTANSLDDAAGNAVQDLTAASVDDGAAPVLRTDGGNQPAYTDADSNGTVDRAILVFTEAVTVTYSDGDWTATANDLTDFDTTGYTSGNGSETIYLTATAQTGLTGVGAGTEPQLAFTATTGSIVDTSANALASFSASMLADQADAVVLSQDYNDINGDGQVDRFDVNFSEVIALGECEAGDYTIAGADAGSIAVSSCATSGAELRLTVSNAPATDTNLTVTLAYTQANGTADSLEDAGGRAVADISALTLADAAAPVATSYSYLDTNTDGTVDRLDVSFTEDIAYDECEAGDYSFGGADAGSIAVSACAASDADLQLTLSNATSQDTSLTLEFSYAQGTGVTNSLDDAAGNAVASISDASVSDAAAPVAISAEYLDTNTDGTVDRVDVTFTESVTLDSYDASDWSFPEASELTLSDSGASASGSEIQLTVSADSNETGHDTTPTVTYTNNGNRLNDGTNNTSTFGSAINVTDSAAPKLRTDGSNAARYQDNNGDGQIDRVQLVFTEDITLTYDDADWTAVANNLTSFDVSGVTSGGDDSTETLVLTATAASTLTGVNGATEPTLAFSDATNLTDGTNALTSFGAISLVDAASPVSRTDGSNAIVYNDLDNDGTIDRVGLTFTEYVTVTYDDGDWSATANDLTSFDVSGLSAGGDGSTASVNLTASAQSNLTGVSGGTEPSLAFTATTGSIVDGTGNAVSAISDRSLLDLAVPFIRTDGSNAPKYQDTNSDGQIDAVVLTFTENTTVTYDDSDWTATANDLTSFDVSALASGGDGTGTTATFTATAAANLTGVSAGTEPTLAYSSVGGVFGDAGGNNASSQSAITLVDAASPVRVSQSYKDINTDGTVDRVDITFSENIAYDECEVSDYTLAGADVGSTTIASCAVSTTDLQLTLSGATANDTSLTLTLAYDASNSTADSLDDGTAGNAVGDLSAASISDGAAPVALSAEYLDTNTDGTVDRVDVTFTEDVTLDSYNASDWSFPESSELTLSDSGASASGVEIQLTVSADSNETGHSTTPTVLYTNNANRLNDGTNNTATFGSAINVADAAAPMLISSVPDNGAENVAWGDDVVMTFTESMATGSFAYTLTGSGASVTDTWSSSDTVLTLSQSSGWGSGSKVTITITAGPDSAANSFAGAIGSANPFTFTAIFGGSESPAPITYGTYYTLELTDGTGTVLSQVEPGQSVTIQWTENGFVNATDLYYQLGSQANWTYITATTSDRYSWVVPETSFTSMKVRAVNADHASFYTTASVSLPEPEVVEEEQEEFVGDPDADEDPSDTSDTSDTSDGGTLETLVKTDSGSEVYALFPDNTRRVFINSSTYFTWEESFSAIDEVEEENLRDYRLIGVMLPRNGVVLVKIQSIDRVYFLAENPDDPFKPILRWIPTESVAAFLFGEDWADYVIDIEPTFFTKFDMSPQELTLQDILLIDLPGMRKREELAQPPRQR